MGFLPLPFYLCCLGVLAVTAQSTTEEPCTTSKQQDIIFVLDSSTSIARPDFKKQLDFVNSLIDKIDIGPDANQVGVISFSNSHRVNFHLNANSNKNGLEARVSAIRQMGGNTFTHKPLEYLRRYMFDPKRGDRLEQDNVCVVITDGQASNPERTAKAAQALAGDGVRMFAVGVGNRVDRAGLLDITGNNDRVFQVASYDDLKDLSLSFSFNVLEVCPTGVPSTVAPTTVTPTTVVPTTVTPTTVTTTTVPPTTVTPTTVVTTTVAPVILPPIIAVMSKEPVQIGREISLKCSSKTVSPDVRLYWYSDGALMSDRFYKIEGDSVVSFYSFTSKQDDDGRNIECHLSHPSLASEMTAVFEYTPEPCTTSKQQDIIFVLDSSTSIARADFQKQLRFVNSLIDNIDIGPEANQVGIISFASRNRLNFHLNDNSNKTGLEARVSEIRQMGGNTFTHKPLEYIKSGMFVTKRGDRLDRDNVCVVITDGQSSDPERTTKAAQALADDGVHMFAVGVGSGVDSEDLLHIAGSNDRVFQVVSYQELKDLSVSFSQTVLGVCLTGSLSTIVPPTVALPAVVPPAVLSEYFPVPEPCTTSKQQDIIFVLDSSTSIARPDFKKQLNFINSLIDNIDVGPDASQIGIVSFASRIRLNFHLDANSNKTELQARVSEIRQMGGNTFTYKPLEYIKSDMFVPTKGDRMDKENVCVVITDGQTSDPERTTKAATALADDGVHMFALGVGPKVDTTKLIHIAGSSDRVFQVVSYQELNDLSLVFSETVLGACLTGKQELPGDPTITGGPATGSVIDRTVVKLVCASLGTSRYTELVWYEGDRLVDRSQSIMDGYVINEYEFLAEEGQGRLECRMSFLPADLTASAYYEMPAFDDIKAPDEEN